MSVHTGRAELTAALKSFHERWSEVQQYWQDAVRQTFAEEYWQRLEAQTQATLTAMDRLAQVLHQARRDCG